MNKLLESDVPGVLRCSAIRTHAAAVGNGGLGFHECEIHHECRVYREYCAHLTERRESAVLHLSAFIDAVRALEAQVTAKQSERV